MGGLDVRPWWEALMGGGFSFLISFHLLSFILVLEGSFSLLIFSYLLYYTISYPCIAGMPLFLSDL